MAGMYGLLSPVDDDFAELIAGFEPLVRLGALFGFEDLVNDRRKLVGIE